MSDLGEDISVIIVTHNRKMMLKNLLSSIKDASHGLVGQIIIVDDSGSEYSECRSDFPSLPIDYVHLPDRVFISRAKNIALKMSRGEFSYFVDDDNVVTADTLRIPYETIRNNSTMGAVMPAVLYRDDPSMVWVYATPFRNGRWGFQLRGRNLPRDPSLENKLLDTDALPNASIVRTSAAIRVGGFDELLEVNSSAYFCYRLKAAGWKVVANTGAFTYHDVELPLRFGYWMQHQVADPERVRRETREWFWIMARVHPEIKHFRSHAMFHFPRVALPNTAAYLARGGNGRTRLMGNQMRGMLEGLSRPR
ncbi:MAG: glycosyltransferase [Candidatus Thermoplasmatota archaeon]|jgi:GT2 family glycosyltransferase|nr:glycosyltransferase [Candidatus Thermoplasmatota archaeon]MCL5793891.1 glycosyltransferase [Candidatus Thermoplasmatota archaeon]